MRTIFTAVTLVILVNLLALAGFAGWLASSGRLSKARVHEVVDVFRPTVAEEEAAQAEIDALAEETQAVAEQAMHMQQVANGPVSPERRLSAMGEIDEQSRMRIERRRVELDAMYRQLDSVRALVDGQIAELEQERLDFEADQQEWLDGAMDADFQQAVTMLEGLTSRQAKDVFLQLIRENNEEQVVAYLAAMTPRKAAGVLKEFKDGGEVAQAARLIEQIRQRSERVVAQETGA